MNLYEINEKLQNFNLEVDEETGEVLNIDELDNLELAKNEKIENICLYIKNLKADAEAYENEKQAFADREKRATNKAKSLQRYLENILNGEKFETTKAKCTWRKSEKVEVTDMLSIPRQYIKVKEDVDKTELKKALKNGDEIKGAKLVENNNLSIK